MWNNKRSILLSKACTILFMGALFILCIFAPCFINWLTLHSRTIVIGMKGLFLTTIYAGTIPAAALLWSLYRVLHRISLDQVFVAENVSALRLISWCCFLGAGICLVSSLYYFPWCIVSMAAAFIGLIVRVVKNVFDQALILKDEADFTI